MASFAAASTAQRVVGKRLRWRRDVMSTSLERLDDGGWGIVVALEKPPSRWHRPIPTSSDTVPVRVSFDGVAHAQAERR